MVNLAFEPRHHGGSSNDGHLIRPAVIELKQFVAFAATARMVFSVEEFRAAGEKGKYRQCLENAEAWVMARPLPAVAADSRAQLPGRGPDTRERAIRRREERRCVRRESAHLDGRGDPAMGNL